MDFNAREIETEPETETKRQTQKEDRQTDKNRDSNRVLTSCQPHSLTSGRSTTVISQDIFYNRKIETERQRRRWIRTSGSTKHVVRLEISSVKQLCELDYIVAT